jgi:hypothetical protein
MYHTYQYIPNTHQGQHSSATAFLCLINQLTASSMVAASCLSKYSSSCTAQEAVQIQMYLVPNQNVDFARIVRCITRRYVLLQSSTSCFVRYLSMYHCGIVPTEYILVCTCNSNTFTSLYQYVLGMYWYILSKTKKRMCIILGNLTKDLMHSILHTIPPSYYCLFHGNIIGKYNIHIQ